MYNVYYELHSDHKWGCRYWVENNVRNSGGNGIIYHNYTMNIADRAWLESDYTVNLIKNRHGESGILPSTILEDFKYVKLKARNLTMMSMRKFSEGMVYVAFPPVDRNNYSVADCKIPDGVEEWLTKNTKCDWGTIGDRRTGVFLKDEDAVAFKLKWM